MKALKRSIRVIAVVIGVLMPSSCITMVFNEIAHQNDFDPYSKKRNEDRSLVGFFLNDFKFYESHDGVIVSQMTTLVWNIVTIDDEDYILAIVPTGWAEGAQPMLFAELYLLMPYSSVVMGVKYNTSLYSAIALASDKKVFIKNDSDSSDVFIPIKVSVCYQKSDSEGIQGSFQAEGETVKMLNEKNMDIILKDGIFNLVYGDGYNSGLTYDNWLSRIINNSVFYFNEQDNAEIIAAWKAKSSNNE